MGTTNQEKDWGIRASRFLKAELRRAGIGYKELAERLSKQCMEETETSITGKLARGTFAASFLLATMEAIGMEQVNILQGAFMEVFMPGMGAIDLEKGTIGFFGDGERPIEVTSVEDTARMTARVALDRSVATGKFAFAGDRISFCEAGRIVGAQMGVDLKPVSYGSEADLRAAMAAATPEKRVMLAYLLYMTNGQAAQTHLQNDRYPDLRLGSFADFASVKLPVAA